MGWLVHRLNLRLRMASMILRVIIVKCYNGNDTSKHAHENYARRPGENRISIDTTITMARRVKTLQHPMLIPGWMPDTVCMTEFDPTRPLKSNSPNSVVGSWLRAFSSRVPDVEGFFRSRVHFL